jgi:imidazoleglycerol phosphate synthase glutamine amidotransferase subunit HisH
MDVSEKTLDRLIKDKYKGTFEEAQDHFRAYGRASLLRTQFKLAERNPTMAIWLGKQYLGQTDPNSRRPPGESKALTRLDQFLDETE